MIRSSTRATQVSFGDLDRKYGFPDGLLASMWQQESGCGQNMRSPKGAEGHFQFMPATRGEVLKETGLDPWSDDPRVAAECAGHYLSKQLKRFDGDMAKALAAYNAGGGNVNQAVAKRGSQWLASLTGETRQYVPDILGRIGLQGRMEFTARYARGDATDPKELARERVKRQGILRDFLGMDEERIAKMDDLKLFGTDFLAMLVSFVLDLFSNNVAMGRGADMPSHATLNLPSTPSWKPAPRGAVHA